MNNRILLTAEGEEKLKQELDYLKSVKMKEIAKRIQEAASYGDLRENSEYDEEKNVQGKVAARINQLEDMLRNAEIVVQDNQDSGVVNLGSKVTVKECGTDDIETFEIVDITNSDPMENKISNASPVGQVLLGKKKGDIVNVTIPNGVIKYEIIEVS